MILALAGLHLIGWDDQRNATRQQHRLVVGLCQLAALVAEVARDTYHRALCLTCLYHLTRRD